MLKQPDPPKYWTLAEALRRKVLSGTLRPGDRVPSLAEMMAEHKVSRATIEKVYTLLEQEGLIVREQGRGTFVAEPKRAAATGVIGVVGDGFGERHHSLYWANLLKGIRSGAHEHGMHILMVDHDVDQPWLFNCWDKIDGVIMCGSHMDILLQWMPKHVHAVSLLIAVPNVPGVLADEYSGMKQATQELIRLGHRRIAYTPVRYHPLSMPRINGYLDALREAGINPNPQWIRPLDPEFDPRESRLTNIGRQRMREWLDDNWRELGCTALLTQNDEAAIGAIQVLQEAGLHVPEDVSVIGFDGTEIIEHFSPQLATVKMPLEQIGHTGVECLVQQLEDAQSDPDTARTVVLPTEVHLAASVAAAPSPEAETED